MDPGSMLSSVGSSFSGMVPRMMFWIAYGLVGLMMVAGMYMFFIYTQHKIKATVFPLYGSGKDGVFAIGRPKTNRIRWAKNKQVWKKLFPIFNKEEIEPFDTEFIYPGNRVYVFELNNQWVPGRVNIDKTENEMRGEINPVPYYVRNWESLQHKKAALEFAEHSFWDDNKMLIMGVITVGICLACCLATVYLTYKQVNAGVPVMERLSDAIKGMNVIPSLPPG